MSTQSMTSDYEATERETNELADLLAQAGRGPSEREGAIYEAICLEGRPAAEVGQEFGLAATTARNIALKTQRAYAAQWRELSNMSSVEALQVHLAKLEAQWQMVMHEWHRSKEVSTTRQMVQKAGENDFTKRITTRTQYGQCRFLEQARKIMSEQHVVMLKLEKAELAAKQAQLAAAASPPPAEKVELPSTPPVETRPETLPEPRPEPLQPAAATSAAALDPETASEEWSDMVAAERLVEQFGHLPFEEFQAAVRRHLEPVAA